MDFWFAIFFLFCNSSDLVHSLGVGGFWSGVQLMRGELPEGWWFFRITECSN